MKHITFISILLSLLCFGGCGEEKKKMKYPDFVPCKDMTIIKALNEEPAYIRKHCFDYTGRTDAFIFELVNPHSEFFSESGLFPCEEIPEQYRQEGLSVSISGDVTSCVTGAGCSAPNIKLASIHFFKLKDIKINN